MISITMLLLARAHGCANAQMLDLYAHTVHAGISIRLMRKTSYLIHFFHFFMFFFVVILCYANMVKLICKKLGSTHADDKETFEIWEISWEKGPATRFNSFTRKYTAPASTITLIADDAMYLCSTNPNENIELNADGFGWGGNAPCKTYAQELHFWIRIFDDASSIHPALNSKYPRDTGSAHSELVNLRLLHAFFCFCLSAFNYFDIWLPAEQFVQWRRHLNVKIRSQKETNDPAVTQNLRKSTEWFNNSAATSVTSFDVTP